MGPDVAAVKTLKSFTAHTGWYKSDQLGDCVIIKLPGNSLTIHFYNTDYSEHWKAQTSCTGLYVRPPGNVLIALLSTTSGQQVLNPQITFTTKMTERSCKSQCPTCSSRFAFENDCPSYSLWITFSSRCVVSRKKDRRSNNSISTFNNAWNCQASTLSREGQKYGSQNQSLQ